MYFVALWAMAMAMPALFKRDNIDVDILQFALTLEQLENAFYKGALSTWSVDDFTNANFTADFYSQLKYIAHDEQVHLLFLEAALEKAGVKPVKPCTYKFPSLTPKTFVELAATVEGVGASAYLGAAPYVTSKTYLTDAASILVAEALHQAALRGAVGEVPMANPFGTPLSINAVYSIASAFIEECPSSNAPLPVKAYKQLNVTQGTPFAPNNTATFLSAAKLPDSFYLTFVNGLSITTVKGNITEGSIEGTIPSNVRGQAYVFVTKDNSGNLTDSSIISGPAILEVTPPSPAFDLSIQ